MKIITFALLLICNAALSQCTIDNLSPFNFGISKFDAMERSNDLKTWQPEYNTPISTSSWRKEKYFKNDSVYVSEAAFDMKKADCFNGDSNYIRLYFADDKLYKFHVFMRYEVTNYLRMKKDYENLAIMLQSNYEFGEPFKEVDKTTNEQKSQGVSFYKQSKQMRNNLKQNNVSLSYNIHYKTSQEFYGLTVAPKIEYYMIEVIFVNLEGTKFTTQGYH